MLSSNTSLFRGARVTCGDCGKEYIHLLGRCKACLDELFERVDKQVKKHHLNDHLNEEVQE